MFYVTHQLLILRWIQVPRLKVMVVESVGERLEYISSGVVPGRTNTAPNKSMSLVCIGGTKGIA